MNTPGSMIKQAKCDMKQIDTLFKEIEHKLVCEEWHHHTFPCGRERYKNREWEAKIKKYLENEDTDFEVYCAWCQGGCGDEYIMQEE